MNARRLILPVLAAMLGALVFACVPALASAAEAPKVEEGFVSDVASSSATLNATVNPGGAETSYRFEYASVGGAFKSVPEPEGSGSLPEGTAGVPLSVHVQQGLAPGASYEFRLVASNSVEVVTGESVSFIVERAGGEFRLPDGRQYEMVTPPEKEGALFYGIGIFDETPGGGEDHLVQASAAGNAIADVASQPTEAEPQGYDNFVSVLSTRGPGGWSSRVIAPPRDVVSRNQIGEEYRLFSEDLSRAVVQPFGKFEALSPEASESTPYLHTDYLNGDVGELCQDGCFQPLVTRADDTASPFEPFGNAGCVYFFCGPTFEAASADLSYMVIRSGSEAGGGVPLTSTPIHTEGREGLYEWFNGQLRLVSAFPPGEEDTESPVATAGVERSAPEVERGGARRAVSEDGERVLFKLFNGGPLYLRDFARGETIKINEGPTYFTANTDDSRVFYKSGEDLYEFQLTSGPGEPLAGRAVDLSVDPHAGESADVVAVLGASNDGSYVYFAAGGALTPNAAPGTCEQYGVTEGCNLYVSHDGVTSLVTAGWIEGGGQGANLWARVSPDGKWLAFMSSRSLTGYDNRDAVSGHPDDEVYLYDASIGGLVCASCDPTGARPVGLYYGEGATRAAANVPRWTYSGGFFAPKYQSRYLSDSGRLFFESRDALVPQDVNGTEDVYEYEPEGVGGCTSSSSSGSVVVKPTHGFDVGGRGGEEGAGCVGLISAGTASQESTFLDASESGGDVFFRTNVEACPAGLRRCLRCV